jgi:Bardet-Biedl syndrome 1 protein
MRATEFSGTTVISENVVLEEPVAVCSYYTDYKTPRRPVIAVGSGIHVFLYKNLQPYFKFTLPPVQLDVEEQEIWNKLSVGKYDTKTGYEELFKLREQNRQLTIRSYELLSLTDKDEISDFTEQRRAIPLNTQVNFLFQFF